MLFGCAGTGHESQYSSDPNMCLTSCFAVLGTAQDPAIEVPLQQMREWIGLWHSAQGIRDIVRPVWTEAVNKVLATAEHVRAHKVRGPLGALLTLLLGLGWHLEAADHWGTEEGLQFEFGEEHASDLPVQVAPLLQALQGSIERRQWEVAALGWHGT